MDIKRDGLTEAITFPIFSFFNKVFDIFSEKIVIVTIFNVKTVLLPVKKKKGCVSFSAASPNLYSVLRSV